jgi:hypothetical protein
MESRLIQEFAKGSVTKEELRTAVEHDFHLLPLVIDGVSSPKAKVRYGCAKVLVT